MSKKITTLTEDNAKLKQEIEEIKKDSIVTSKANERLRSESKTQRERIEQLTTELAETKTTMNTIQSLHNTSQREKAEVGKIFALLGLRYELGKTSLTYAEYRQLMKRAEIQIDRINAEIMRTNDTLKRKYDALEKSVDTVRNISAQLNNVLRDPAQTLNLNDQTQPVQPTSAVTRFPFTMLTPTTAASCFNQSTQTSQNKQSDKVDISQDDTDEESEPANKSAKVN